MKCYWATDKEVGRYHVPGCMGAAVYGPHGCTCSAIQRKKAIEQKMVDLQARVEKLEALLRAAHPNS
jgi:hypothetical protein